MTPFRVTCEHCDASFKISDTSKIGKRVKCPKCAEPFTVQSPEDDFGADDFDDEFAAAPAPASRRAAPGTRKGSKSKKSAAKNEDFPLLVWVGGGSAVVLLAFVGMWAAGLFGGAKNQAPPPAAVVAPSNDDTLKLLLDRLPANTEVLMHLRLKDALASPLMSVLLTPEFREQLKTPNPLIPGTTVSGISSVTLAMSDVSLRISEQKRAAATTGTPTPPGPDALPKDPLTIVVLNDPITPEFLNLPPEQATKHGDYTIYTRPEMALTGTPPCLAIADPKTVVLGTEAQVKRLLDQKDSSGLAGDFGFLNSNAHLTLAFCPRGIVQQMERMAVSQVEIPAALAQMNAFAQMGGRAAGLQLSLTTDLDAAVAVSATDKEKAAALKSIIEAQVQSMRQSYESPAAAANPLLGPLKPIVDSIQVTDAGEQVLASTRIPKDALLQLGQTAYGMAAPMLGAGGMMAPPMAAPAADQ